MVHVLYPSLQTTLVHATPAPERRKNSVNSASCAGKEGRTALEGVMAQTACKGAGAHGSLQEKVEEEVKTKRGKQIVLHYHIL